MRLRQVWAVVVALAAAGALLPFAEALVSPAGRMLLPGVTDACVEQTIVTTAANGLTNWIPDCLTLSGAGTGTTVTWAAEPALHWPQSLDVPPNEPGTRCFDHGDEVVGTIAYTFRVVDHGDPSFDGLYAVDEGGVARRCDVTPSAGVYVLNYWCGFHKGTMPAKLLVRAS